MTDFVTQCVILGQLYENYKEEKDFKAFIEYNDLGLPLAYLTAQGLVVEVSDDGRRYIAVDIPLHANQNVYNLFVLPLTFPKKQASYYFK